MDVLIRGLEGLFRRVEILLVRRIPPTKTLRAHLFGLTLALAGVFLTLVIDRTTLFAGMPWYWLAVTAGIFILGTALGGPFVILAAIAFFSVAASRPLGSPAFSSSVVIIAAWYFIFYAIGATFVLIYDFFSLLSLLTFGNKQVKIVFAYDTKKRLNVIKAPDPAHEKALYAVLSARPHLQKQKLYDFELNAMPPHPYTIAFVANPIIRHRREDETFFYEPDPIMKDLDLFLRTVHSALFSFEQDDILGQKQIWSRIRVLAVFDETTTKADGTTRSDDDRSLVQDFQQEIPAASRVAESFILPRAEMVYNVCLMLDKHQSDLLPFSLSIRDIDMIVAVSGSAKQFRPTAYYCDFDERINLSKLTNYPLQPSPGKKFIYNRDPNATVDPLLQKDGEIVNISPCGEPPVPPVFSACIHDEYSVFPGRMAINAVSARRHTYIHEFAHAMSSAVRGAIGDEYYDKAVLLKKDNYEFIPFYVNRIERKRKLTPAGAITPEMMPIHQVFARYNDSNFLSDLTHPTTEAESNSYYPEREQGITCTMDHDDFPYAYDKLLRRFIYDRLVTKLNRQGANPFRNIPIGKDKEKCL